MAFAFACAFAAAACSVPVTATDAATPTVHAVYAVTRTTELTTAGAHTDASEVVARFLVGSEPDADPRALELVGAALALPSVGACLQFGRARLPVLSGPVDLSDPGTVVLRVGDRETAMTRRHLPDVADLIRGSVFTSNTVDFPVGAHYEFRSSAGTARGVAPEALAQVRLGDEELIDGLTIPNRAARTIELTWARPSSVQTQPAASLVYVDIASRDGLSPTTRCTFDDRGSASLPAVAFEGIQDGTISVHRVRREIEAHPSSELRFDFAVRASFHALPR